MIMQETAARAFKAALVSAMALATAMALSLCCSMALGSEQAYADGRAGAHQTAPTPDHVIAPKELVGKWSPNPDDDEAIYIEFRYDEKRKDLVYFYYMMAYDPFGKGGLKSGPSEFEFNHGYVALQGNHGTCDCYLTDGSRAYESFYVSGAANGVIYAQDDGKEFRKVGKPGAWREWLSWPTRPDCYDETTIAAARGNASLGSDAGSGKEAAPIEVTNLKATNVTSINALLSATAYKDPSVKVKNCGIYLGLSEATMQRENIEAVPDAHNGYHNLNVWYDLNDELGITLEPHTTYYYAFYCEVGDVVYLSDTSTFTTA